MAIRIAPDDGAIETTNQPANMPTFAGVQGAQLLSCGLILPDSLTGEQLGVIGDQLARLGNSWRWAVADFLVRSEKHGQQPRFAEAFGLDSQTVYNWTLVARAVEVSRRRETLSFSHHSEVAALPDNDQVEWLAYAESERLSLKTFREQLRQAKAEAEKERERAQIAANSRLHVELTEEPEPDFAPPIGSGKASTTPTPAPAPSTEHRAPTRSEAPAPASTPAPHIVQPTLPEPASQAAPEPPRVALKWLSILRAHHRYTDAAGRERTALVEIIGVVDADGKPAFDILVDDRLFGRRASQTAAQIAVERHLAAEFALEQLTPNDAPEIVGDSNRPSGEDIADVVGFARLALHTVVCAAKISSYRVGPWRAGKLSGTVGYYKASLIGPLGESVGSIRVFADGDIEWPEQIGDMQRKQGGAIARGMLSGEAGK